MVFVPKCKGAITSDRLLFCPCFGCSSRLTDQPRNILNQYEASLIVRSLFCCAAQGQYVEAWNCYTDRFVTFLGECIMFSTITAKTFRIWRVFKNPRLQRTIYKPWQVKAIFIAYPTLALVLFTANLLSGLLSDEPPTIDVCHGLETGLVLAVP